MLPAKAGRDPYDKGLTDLVGELTTRSEAFRTRLAAQDVGQHRTGISVEQFVVEGTLGELRFQTRLAMPTYSPLSRVARLHGSLVAVALVAVVGLVLASLEWAAFMATPALVVFDFVLVGLSSAFARHG
jgi:MmyB-like transcription regulator ligand binding domain